jgi:uncharacterized protein
MNCPKCHADLHPVTFEGVEVDFCSSCKGIWCDQDELAFMAELPADIPEAAELEKEAHPTQYPCPRCEGHFLLEEMRFAKTDPLLIDRCPQCKGIWLDNGEFRKLEKIAAHMGNATSKLLLASQKLGERGYTILGAKA